MKSITQAAILAGGPGLRLRPLTADRPKPMVEVNGRPFLDYLIELLKKNGITDIVLLLGYLHEKITAHVGDGSKFGVRVKYQIGTVEDGTGTRLRDARSLLSDQFLLLYCDNYIPSFNLELLQRFHDAKNVLATVTVYTNRHGVTKNNIFVDADGYVTKYDKERKAEGLNGVELGFFVINRNVFDLMPANENFFFENVVLPKLIERKQLAGFTTDCFYYSIGSPARVEATARFLTPKKVVFLDRDGVINKKMPAGDYVKTWREFEFLPGALEAIKLLTDRGHKIYIISNQAGIARGKMTEGDLLDIHRRMEEEVKRHGGKIRAIYYCPHRWDSNCDCRKPKPGMLLQAALDHFIHLPDAVFVGDDERDKEAGNAAGCKTILLREGEGLLEAAKQLA